MVRSYRLMVAPNGARRGKADHPALPVTPDELATTARRCYDAGADAIHLHVRDDAGRHSLDPGRYRAAMAAVGEAAPDMAIQITTESAGVYDVPAQFACLDALRPQAASVAVREMARDPDLAARLYALAREAGIDIQHILYTPECLARFRAWRADGVIGADQAHAILVLGAYSPPTAGRAEDIDIFRPALGTDIRRWATCAFGAGEHACLLAALRDGGEVRIGFENNLNRADGTPYADNAASVAAFVATARAEGFEPHRFTQSEPV